MNNPDLRFVDAVSRLRRESAITATQLALDKWAALAWGTNRAKDSRIREEAEYIYNCLSAALEPDGNDE